MAYLGKTPSQAVRSRFYFTASGGETSLAPAQVTGLSFTDANYVDVSLNGVALVSGTDYTATPSTNTISGLSALTASDVVEIVVYDVFSVFGGNVKGDFTISNGTLAAEAVTVTGLTTTGNINFGDNDKAIFGAGSDLQIYHDGSASYVDDVGAGNLFVRGNNLALKNADGSKSYFFGTNGGAANIYYDGSSKLATTATGVNVTGTVTASTGVEFGTGVSSMPLVTGSGHIVRTSGAGSAPFNQAGSLLYLPRQNDTDGRSNHYFYTGATPKLRQNIKANGDISFYDSTGTTQGLFWDASTQRLGLGVTGPATKLHISGNASNASALSDTVTDFALKFDSATTGGNFSNAICFAEGNNVNASIASFDGGSGGAQGLVFGTGASNTERMRIDSSGRVGIGKSSPNQKLDVLGGNIAVSSADTYQTTVNIDNTDTGGRQFGLHSTGSSNTAGAFRIYDYDANAERMRIDSSGLVQINTTSGNERLNVHGAIGASAASAAFGGGLERALMDYTGSVVRFGHVNGASGSAKPVTFLVAGAEKARLDASGNLLVGKTSTASNVVGAFILNNGLIRADVDGGVVGVFNRKTSDGDALVIQRDGSTVGSIGVSGGECYIGTDDTGLRFDKDSESIKPFNTSTVANRDDAINLGGSSERFNDIFATNGTIQTSDQQEKNTITDSDLGLDFINRLSPKSYIFNGKTRTHYGLIAQDVETVLGDISKPTSGFAGFIKSDISDEQDGSEYRYGLRYTEFVGPLIQAIKDLKAENDAMRARLDALENAQ